MSTQKMCNPKDCVIVDGLCLTHGYSVNGTTIKCENYPEPKRTIRNPLLKPHINKGTHENFKECTERNCATDYGQCLGLIANNQCPRQKLLAEVVNSPMWTA